MLGEDDDFKPFWPSRLWAASQGVDYMLDVDDKSVWPRWLWATSQGYEMYSHQSNHHSVGTHHRGFLAIHFV
jgi:hypothetical protein